MGRWRGRGGDLVAGGVAKAPAARRGDVDRVAALVHEPVVMATEQDEVVEAGLAAPGPVDDVVGVDKPVPLTTRELTAPVAGQQRPANRGAASSGFFARPRAAAVAFYERDDRAVAGEAPRGLGRDPGAVGDRTGAGLATSARGVVASVARRHGGSPGSARPPVRARLAGGRARASEIASRDSALVGRRVAATEPQGESGERRFRGTARLEGGRRSRGAAAVRRSRSATSSSAAFIEGVARRLERAQEERPVVGGSFASRCRQPSSSSQYQRT